MGPSHVFTPWTKNNISTKTVGSETLRTSQHLPASMLCTANDGTQGLTLESCITCPVTNQHLLTAGLQRFATTCVIDRDVHNVTLVVEHEDTLCFIDTLNPDKLSHNAGRDWAVALKQVVCPDRHKLFELAKVQYVRPFTRFSQRRLGWGDVEATKAKVAEAVDDEDLQELVALFPAARSLVQQNKLQDISTLFEAFTSAQPPLGTAPLALTYQPEAPVQDMVVAPPGLVLSTDALVCRVPPHAMQSLHDVTGHEWKPSKEECDLCDNPPCDCGGKHCAACKANVQTWQCECGIVRCCACRHVHAWTPARQAEACTLADCGQASCKSCSCGAARCADCFKLEGGSLVEAWTFTHPAHKPATCYVTEMQKVRDADQLVHLRLELGQDADLITFAEKYRQRFGASATKGSCLHLFRSYGSINTTAERGQYPSVAEARKNAYAMECQVSPRGTGSFPETLGRRCTAPLLGVPL